jgi:hypothetical protein
LVGAQTGFLQGPAMHSNMASDYWEPGHFRDLSARLVRQNRMIVVGAACLAIMLWTQGEAAVLVVLYSSDLRAAAASLRPPIMQSLLHRVKADQVALGIED